MTDNEKLSCLIDRPCTACKFHKENGCSKWSCVFEEKSDVPGTEKGEWIITYPNGKYNPIYECPKCKASNNAVFKNFCPNCGADMRG